MRTEANSLSMAFQSMSSLFQSLFSCSPKRTVSDGTSFSAVITNRRSPSRSMVAEVGMLTWPSRQRREMTKRVVLMVPMSFTLLPKMAGLCT